MNHSEITKKDGWLASLCWQCPVCRTARTRQKGMLFWLVKRVENRMCPACKAYEKVYGKKAHELLSEKNITEHSRHERAI